MPLTPLSVSDVELVGAGLKRPEDVVVGADGRVFASNLDAVAEILPDGSVRSFGEGLGECNGIAMFPDGRIAATDYSWRGGVRTVDPESGAVEVLAEEADGRRLTFANYPVVDSRGSAWVSCSTASEEWVNALVRGTEDGFIVRIDPDGSACVVAEGLAYANGLALDADEAFLYCCQTARGDVVRFPVLDDRSLGAKEPYGPPLGERRPEEFELETGMAAFADPEAQRRWGLTDGCGFDVEGNLWVTVVSAGRVAVITPDGDLVPVLDDPSGTTVALPTNVAWGGNDLRDLYVGTLGAGGVLKARSPIPGMPLAHQR